MRGGGNTIYQSFYLFDKIRFSKATTDRLGFSGGKKNTRGYIVGFYKNKLTQEVEIIAATDAQKAPLVLVKREDWPDKGGILVRHWGSDAYIRNFNPGEKMVVLDIPVIVEIGGDYGRQLKKVSSDNTIDSILQLNRSGSKGPSLSKQLADTLQVLLHELFVTYHQKHHDDKVPFYVAYKETRTTDAPNADKLIVQIGIPPITLQPVEKLLDELKLEFKQNLGASRDKQETYLKYYVESFVSKSSAKKTKKRKSAKDEAKDTLQEETQTDSDKNAEKKEGFLSGIYEKMNMPSKDQFDRFIKGRAQALNVYVDDDEQAEKAEKAKQAEAQKEERKAADEKAKAEKKPFVPSQADELMLGVFDRILHRHSSLKINQGYHQFNTTNVYLPVWGFVEKEIIEEDQNLLDNMPAPVDIYAISRFAHEIEGFNSTRVSDYFERLGKELDLPEGTDVSAYLQAMANEWDEYEANVKALRKQGEDIAAKIQKLYVKLNTSLNPQKGLADLRADVREANTRHPSSRGEVLMEFGNRFLNGMYISQLQNDVYSGYTHDMVRHTLELFNPFSITTALPVVGFKERHLDASDLAAGNSSDEGDVESDKGSTEAGSAKAIGNADGKKD